MELSRDGRERWVWIHWQISRPSLAIGVAVVVLMGGWMITNRFRATMASPHWDRYMSFVCSAENEHGKAVPSDELLEELRSVIKWTPDDPRAHAALARLDLKRFEQVQQSPTAINPLPLHQIRDAAMQSKFQSRQSLDRWLANAVGDHCHYLDEALRHTREALRQCPLQGEAYLFLGELCFLENALPETKDAYIAQAIRVRPFNGDVLVVAGREACLAGDQDRAIELWKRGFDQNPYEREMLINAASSAGIGAIDFLEIFKPGWPEIGIVYKTYSKIAAPDELRVVRDEYLATADAVLPKLNGTDAAAAYFEMYGVFAETGPASRAMQSLQNAIKANPNNLNYRHTLGLALWRDGDYAAAEKELNWCLQREPNNRGLKEELAQVVKLRVAEDGGSRSAFQSKSNMR